MKRLGVILLSLSACMPTEEPPELPEMPVDENCARIVDYEVLSEGTKIYTIGRSDTITYSDELPPDLCPGQEP